MSHLRILQPGDPVKVTTGVHASRRGRVVERVHNPRSGDELVIEETPRPPATKGMRFCVQATKCEMVKDTVVPA